MGVMSGVEAAFCRSAPWRGFARRVVLPWAIDGVDVRGSFLEIGGGSGAMAEALLRHHTEVHLTVTDVDPAMVAAIRQRLAPFGDRAAVALADVLDLPYGDGNFDGVVSFLMLHHVVEWPEALAEVRRVLRPGGRFLGYDLTHAPVATAIHRLDRSPHRLYRAGDLEQALADAGFTDVDTRPSHRGQLVRFTAVR